MGRPIGTCWAGPPDRRQRHLLLETEPSRAITGIPESGILNIETNPDEGEDPPDIDAAMIRLGRHVVDSGDLGVRFG